MTLYHDKWLEMRLVTTANHPEAASRIAISCGSCRAMLVPSVRPLTASYLRDDQSEDLETLSSPLTENLVPSPLQIAPYPETITDSANRTTWISSSIVSLSFSSSLDLATLFLSSFIILRVYSRIE